MISYRGGIIQDSNIQNNKLNGKLKIQNDFATSIGTKPTPGLLSSTCHSAIILMKTSNPITKEEMINMRKLKFFIFS
jgi:hypothetical protein